MNRPLHKDVKWVLVCQAEGPWHMKPDPQFCGRGEKHDGMHMAWNDDGTIVIRWGDDWVHGDGRWREPELPVCEADDCDLVASMHIDDYQFCYHHGDEHLAEKDADLQVKIAKESE